MSCFEMQIRDAIKDYGIEYNNTDSDYDRTIIFGKMIGISVSVSYMLEHGVGSDLHLFINNAINSIKKGE